MTSSDQPGADKRTTFAEQASVPPPGFVMEFWEFFRSNRKWWLPPIVVFLLLIAWLMVAGGTAAAPFIYTLF